jgi:hypothetical protein
LCERGGGEGGSAGLAPGAEVGDAGALEPGLESGAEVNVLLPMYSFMYIYIPPDSYVLPIYPI